jgi:hypothetical protein
MSSKSIDKKTKYCGIIVESISLEILAACKKISFIFIFTKDLVAESSWPVIGLIEKY